MIADTARQPDQQPARKPLRILMLSHMFPHPDQPGSGPFVHDQASALNAIPGVEVRVVSCRPIWLSVLHPRRTARNAMAFARRLFAGWKTWEGVKVLYPSYLVGEPLGFWLHAQTYLVPVLAVARRIRREFPFDLVHAHTGYLDGHAGVALARKYSVPLVVTEHTNPLSFLTGRIVVRQVTLRALRRADRVLCVSESLAGEVRRELGDSSAHVSVLPNGIDLERFRPSAERRPPGARLVTVAALEEYKNPLLLLEAMALVVGQLPSATLEIAGEGSLRPQMLERIRALGLSRSVSLLGQVERDQVAALLRDRCDLLVVPSRSETFGVAVIEALACGHPVVSTRCGGPEEILTEPWLGRLCGHDPRELADAILAEHRSLPERDPARLHRYVEDRFAIPAVASALLREYVDLCAAKPLVRPGRR
jgi:glycosyltransferase involved in cell wall biosynthesis